MADNTPGTTPVVDHRTAPRGVLPRRAQTWVMAGLALGVLVIVMFTGQPEPATRSVAATSTAQAEPNAGRLLDFQDRLRVLDSRARQQVVDEPRQPDPGPRFQESNLPSEPDPLQVEQQRRDYESLFASNIAFSRRPEAQRVLSGHEGTSARSSFSSTRRGDESILTPPTLDQVADAVVRATTRQHQSAAMQVGNSEGAGSVSTASAVDTAPPDRKAWPAATGPISAAGPLHRILEGTVVDTVLMNRLDGSTAAPVNCLVTNPVYSHSGQHVLVPAGSRVIGETKPVQSVGETRLAVVFHRLVLPDGRTYRLDQMTGLNQVGDAGLKDQVNHHTWSTVGGAGAVGLISGLAQFLGSGGFIGGGDGDRTIVITGGLGNATSQATAQTMSRFLNRLPTVTIREGHRVKVYLTSDLELPEYTPSDAPPVIPANQWLAGGRP